MKGKLILMIGAAASALAIATWGIAEKNEAGSHEVEKPGETRTEAHGEATEPTLALDKQTVALSGIVTNALKPVSHQQETQAFGTVLPPQDFIDLHNRYIGAKAQEEKTQAALAASSKEYERLHALNADGRDVSDKALQAAEAVWRSDEATLRASRANLAAIEGSAAQQWGSVLARAVLGGGPLFRQLMSQQRVVIQVNVPAGMVISSPPKTARVQGPDGSYATGELISRAPRADPRFQGASLFYHAPATVLLPGMTVTAYLPAGAVLPGVVFPASAVVWWQGKAWVYVQPRPGHFERRELPASNPMEDGWFVSQGFVPGETVVVTGAQQLLSQEFRSQIPSGEEGEGGGEKGEHGEKGERK